MYGREMMNIEAKNLKDEHLNSVYEELAGIIGIDAVLRVYMQYKGQQISFPVKLYSKQYVENQIVQEFDGKNLDSLAIKYGFSTRWIREILKRGNQKIHNEEDI